MITIGLGGIGMKLHQVAEHLGARVLTDEALLENNVDNVFCTVYQYYMLLFQEHFLILYLLQMDLF